MSQLRPKVLSTDVADYVVAPFSGKNESGLRPFGDTIMVLPDKAAETAGKAGLLYVPDDVQERMSIASESGVIVAIGADAFKFSAASGRPLTQDEVPKIGDRVLFERYAGRVFKGNDDKIYRVMSDRCVGGVELKPGEETPPPPPAKKTKATKKAKAKS